MRSLLASIAAALVFAAGAAEAKPGVPPLQADEINRLLAANNVPSVSVAEIRNGKVVYAAAFGEQSAGKPATTRSLYNVASLSKPISAEVVLRLASQGRLSLDEPMSSAWVDPDIAGDPRAGKLTARLALSHRTGFPNWRDKKTGLRFVREPGQYGYSGEGYGYVARFAENKAGKPLEALAEDLVFRPAGMRTTAYTGKPWFEGRIAVPADAKGQPLKPRIAKTAIAADLVYSTPSDYARFMLQVMDGRGLTRDLAAQRLRVESDRRPQSCPDQKAPTCPDEAGPGLGWEVARFGPRVYLMHTGRDEGVFTLAYISPTNRSGVIIFTSGDNGAELIMPILEKLNLDPEYNGYLRAQH